LGARAILIFCGDYVDRGPQSAQVVEALVWLQRRAAFELRFLKGNHEQALLDFLEDPEGGRGWLDCGGIDTLQSYGLRSPEPGQSLAPLRDQLLEVLPSHHLDFLRDLKLTTSVGDFLFVHAGLRPGRPVSLQSQEDLLWIREDFTRSEHRFKRVIVHGHSWSSAEPEVRANRIGVDTGAYRTGVLTALRLEGAQIQFISFAGNKTPVRSEPERASGACAATAATGEMEWQARAETRSHADPA
jgi:serine/threonine protein phosphatase 1